MPSPLPYFHFWVKDYLASSGTRRMSLAARGLYVDLLAFQWEDGSIPDDVEEIASMVGIARAEVVKVWPKVRQSFEEIGNGMLANPRLALEREQALEKRDKLSENGSKGGRPKKAIENQLETKSFSIEKQTKTKSKAKPVPIPEGNTDNKLSGVPPVSVKAENTAWDPVQRVLTEVHRRIPAVPMPQTGDVRVHLKPDAPIPSLIRDYGEDKTVELFCFAWTDWPNPPTWKSVFQQRAQIAAKLSATPPVDLTLVVTRKPGEAREVAR